MNNIPKDPVMLLSFINMKLRDEYSSFDELCAALCVEAEDILSKLKSINYSYDSEKNQFV